MPELLPPVTPEDLASFSFVSDAQISPDGTRTAYVVRRIDLDRNEYCSAIWIVNSDGSGEPVRLTSGERQDAEPRWSPDGRRIAFLSDRDGEKWEGRKAPKQVFVVAADGGEPRRLTAGDADHSEPVWSPRGDSLVVVRKPAADPTKKDAPKVYDRVRYRSDEAGLLDERRKHLWLVGAEGKSEKQLTDGDWDDTMAALSPDGALVAFMSNRSADRDRNNVADIWIVSVDGSDPRRLTDELGSYGTPSWSPNSKRIACYGVARASGSAAHNIRLWSFPADGGSGTDLLGDWDRTVGSVVMSDMRTQAATMPPAWSPDGVRVHFLGTDQGTANAYSVSAKGGDLRASTLGAHQVVSISFDAERARYAGVLATPTEPGEVVSGTPGNEPRLLTATNSEFLGSRWLGEPEHVAFTGAQGWRIEGWLMRPRGFDPSKKWPLVLEVHGGPHAAYGHAFFHEFQALAGRGYAVLYTNPRGSHGYGDRFVKACVGDWGGDDYLDLMAAADHAVSLGWVDPERLYLTGGSYGGFMTNWIVGHTDRFKAAATQRSISNNVSAFGTSDIGWHFWQEEHRATPWDHPERLIERSPLTYVQSVRTPLLILHAERDLRCPIEQAEQWFAALKLLGQEAVFVRYQEDNHDLTRGGKPRNRIDHCRRIVDWFDSHP